MTNFEYPYEKYQVHGESDQVARLGDDILRLSVNPRDSDRDPHIRKGAYHRVPDFDAPDFMISTSVFDTTVESFSLYDTPRFALFLKVDLLPDVDREPFVAETLRKLRLERVTIEGGRFEAAAGRLVQPPIDIPPDRYPVTVEYAVGDGLGLELGLLSPQEQRLITDGLIRSLYARYGLTGLDPQAQWEDEVQGDDVDPSEVYPYVARRMGFNVPFDPDEFRTQEEAEDHWAWADSLENADPPEEFPETVPIEER